METQNQQAGVALQLFKPMAAVVEEYLQPRKEQENYENVQTALALLCHYLDTYGSVLLRAMEVPPTISHAEPSSPTSELSTCSLYSADQLCWLFRGFILLFLGYKVDAPHEKKTACVDAVNDFVVWLFSSGYLSSESMASFREIKQSAMAAASTGCDRLRRSLSNRKGPRRVQNVRDMEPFYMISRVRAGKLWCIHFAEDRYDEFGPIVVPLGVTDLVKPGWFIFDGGFVQIEGKWHVDKLTDIIPA